MQKLMVHDRRAKKFGNIQTGILTTLHHCAKVKPTSRIHQHAASYDYAVHGLLTTGTAPTAANRAVNKLVKMGLVAKAAIASDHKLEIAGQLKRVKKALINPYAWKQNVLYLTPGGIRLMDD